MGYRLLRSFFFPCVCWWGKVILLVTVNRGLKPDIALFFMNYFSFAFIKALICYFMTCCSFASHLPADKPPIEELHQFLEFQLPRQWAPVFSELPLGPQRKQQSSASLQFSFMGPKLYVNTSPVMPSFFFSFFFLKW